mmetsp:Transcript_36726/g.36997  ORF Transcript_36726/g.36997 Transcript_36726/m.36997 type:complete len:243 (+) Transcript_36726:481-1209(+)
MPLHTRNAEAAERILVRGHVLEVGVVEIAMMKKEEGIKIGILITRERCSSAIMMTTEAIMINKKAVTETTKGKITIKMITSHTTMLTQNLITMEMIVGQVVKEMTMRINVTTMKVALDTPDGKRIERIAVKLIVVDTIEVVGLKRTDIMMISLIEEKRKGGRGIRIVMVLCSRKIIAVIQRRGLINMTMKKIMELRWRAAKNIGMTNAPNLVSSRSSKTYSCRKLQQLTLKSTSYYLLLRII